MTIKAKVKGFYSSDMGDLKDCAPDDIWRFCVVIRAMVGPKEGEGEESFDINVCSPQWLDEICKRDGFVIGRHYLIVSRYDLVIIKTVINDLVERCEGESWQDVAEKVSRLGYWEFEDYKGKKNLERYN